MSPGATEQFTLFVEVLYEGLEIPDLSGRELFETLSALPCCVTNKKGDRNGDPMNLVVVASGPALLEGFTRAGWDETEVVTTRTGLRTARSFLSGSEYRYSPVSNLYAFGRRQDVAFQKARDTIHERNHLRLWLAPFTFEAQPVWVGQVSRDIGVKFHWRTITTHAIDGDRGVVALESEDATASYLEWGKDIFAAPDPEAGHSAEASPTGQDSR